MMRHLVILALATVAVFPSLAKASPFTPELRIAYGLAVKHWGGPPERCITIAAEVVPDEQLGDRLGEATRPDGTRVPCVLRVRRDLARPSRFLRACAVMRHEVGHLAGLDHSANPNSIMHDPVLFVPAQCWRAGIWLMNHRLRRQDAHDR